MCATCSSASEYAISRPRRAAAHDAGAAQHPQVLGDQRLRRAELLDQLVHAALAGGQLGDDGDAERRGQRAEQLARGLVRLVAGSRRVAAA